MRRLFGETRKVERRGEKRSRRDEESEMGDVFAFAVLSLKLSVTCRLPVPHHSKTKDGRTGRGDPKCVFVRFTTPKEGGVQESASGKE